MGFCFPFFLISLSSQSLVLWSQVFSQERKPPWWEKRAAGTGSSGNWEHWQRSQLKPFCSHSSFCRTNHSLLGMFSAKARLVHPQQQRSAQPGGELPKAPYLGAASTKGWGLRGSAASGQVWQRGAAPAAEEGGGEVKIPAAVCPAPINPAAPILPSAWGCLNVTGTVTPPGHPGLVPEPAAGPGAGGGGQGWASWGQLIRDNELGAIRGFSSP